MRRETRLRATELAVFLDSDRNAGSSHGLLKSIRDYLVSIDRSTGPQVGGDE
jgi:hypothetical protein